MAEINNQVTPEMLEEIAQSGGLKHVVFTAEGAKVEDVPQASIDRAEKNALAQAAKAAESGEVLSLLAPATEVLVETREFEVGGKLLIFNIKRLSYAECSKIDAKRYRRGANGQPDYNSEYAATTGMAWQLHYCLLTNAGTEEKPVWEPLFSMEQLTGKNGLMASPSTEAKDLIYKLLGEIWAVTPELSPFTQAQSLGITGTQ